MHEFCTMFFPPLAGKVMLVAFLDDVTQTVGSAKVPIGAIMDQAKKLVLDLIVIPVVAGEATTGDALRLFLTQFPDVATPLRRFVLSDTRVDAQRVAAFQGMVPGGVAGQAGKWCWRWQS
jgi:hypothetical protein